MANLHQSGEELIQREVFNDDTLTKPASVNIGLYNTSDSLADGDDLAAITTEASGSAYSRIAVALDSTDFDVSASGSNFVASVNKQIEFDISDDEGSFDGWFIAVNYQRQGDGSSEDHLMFSGNLDTTYESYVDRLGVDNISGTLEND